MVFSGLSAFFVALLKDKDMLSALVKLLVKFLPDLLLLDLVRSRPRLVVAVNPSPRFFFLFFCRSRESLFHFGCRFLNDVRR